MKDPCDVGILGGGQLAMMLANAGEKLGIEVGVYEADPTSPVAQTRARLTVGTLRDLEKFRSWLRSLSVLTFENEFVDTRLLGECIPPGLRVFPSLEVLDLVQDKLAQKEYLAGKGFQVPYFREVGDFPSAEAFADRQGWPIVLKERRNGYDGKGTHLLKNREELAHFFSRRESRESLLAEAFVPFTMEIAIQVARNPQGETSCFPLVKTFQTNGVCHWTQAPASLGWEESENIKKMAIRLVTDLDAVGVFAIEMFCSAEGKILINELAPRVHNSGHYTIEGCKTSQFEQHLLAVTGQSLGSSAMLHPGVAMINILGDFEGPYQLIGMEKIDASHPVRLHWYHKRVSGRGRKMGHLTAWGDNSDIAMSQALLARKEIELCPLV